MKPRFFLDVFGPSAIFWYDSYGGVVIPLIFLMFPKVPQSSLGILRVGVVTPPLEHPPLRTLQFFNAFQGCCRVLPSNAARDWYPLYLGWTLGLEDGGQDNNRLPYHPCMAYLHTFSWFFVVNVGKYTSHMDAMGLVGINLGLYNIQKAVNRKSQT